MLGNFATCADVRAGLAEVQVWGDELMKKQLQPVHFPVHDATGASIVIEFVDGQVQVYDNPMAILTNDPVFPWHLQNVRNYVGLTPWDVGSVEINGATYAQTGHGSGMRGLPGDYTPPSRLIRGLFLKQFANPVPDGPAARNQAFHILNAHDIPQGVIREKKLIGQQDDYTQWAVAKDLTNLVFQYRTYEHLAPRTINLKRIDFGPGTSSEIDLPPPVVDDITQALAAY
jgi:choloylglycine hydrolase